MGLILQRQEWINGHSFATVLDAFIFCMASISRGCAWELSHSMMRPLHSLYCCITKTSLQKDAICASHSCKERPPNGPPFKFLSSQELEIHKSTPHWHFKEVKQGWNHRLKVRRCIFQTQLYTNGQNCFLRHNVFTDIIRSWIHWTLPVPCAGIQGSKRFAVFRITQFCFDEGLSYCFASIVPLTRHESSMVQNKNLELLGGRSDMACPEAFGHGFKNPNKTSCKR